MQPGTCRQTFKKIIRKSLFTKLKKGCLSLQLPQLIGLVELLEAAGILLTRERLPTLIDLFLVTLKHGREYVRVQHLDPDYYQRWLAQKEPHESALTCRQEAQFRHSPTIAIFVPAGGNDCLGLQACLESVLHQCYPHWELFLFGFESAPENIQNRIRSLFPPTDKRVHFVANQEDVAINQTLASLQADFVVFPANHDLLSLTALFEVVRLINLHPEADIIYADEDIIDSAGKRSAPFFKPGWSPDLALSLPYTGPFTVYRASLVKALGEVRAIWPAIHYELLLRMMAKTTAAKIHHIPKFLYHRRLAQGKTDRQTEKAKEVASMQILSNYLQRTAQTGKILKGSFPGTYRVLRELQETAGVSIIVPFQDNVPLLAQCLASIFQKTDYPLFEIVLINNQSREKATYDYLQTLAGHPQVRFMDFPQPFNYAAMNNRAVAQAAYQYILFLNNDTEVISPQWLRAMLEHIQRDEVGAVGAKLLFPDNSIQHGGLALGGGGLLCGDYFRGLPEATEVAHGLAQVIRNCSAVTGACLLTKKLLFQAVGGFDEVNLPICYNDVDLCLKLRERGYLIVWTPYARLYHHESASRGKDLKVTDLERLCREQAYFEEKWWALLEQDPYYNPNLSRLFDGYVY